MDLSIFPTEIKYKIFEYVKFFPYLTEIKNLKHIREYNFLSSEINYMYNELIANEILYNDPEWCYEIKPQMMIRLSIYELKLNYIYDIFSNVEIYSNKNVFYNMVYYN